MDSHEALATLRRNEASLRARGIQHAALFGSVARDENTDRSDVDILIEFDPASRVTIFDYVRVKSYIASLFDAPVDVVDREALKPDIRPPAAADIVYAF